MTFAALPPVSPFCLILAWAFLIGPLPMVAASAPDGSALMKLLVRKGILTTQEAEEVRIEWEREAEAPPVEAVAGGTSTSRLGVGMRLQVQGAALATANAVDPAATQQIFLRRVYLTLKAGLGPNWGAVMTYDFAAGGYDDAVIEWKPSSDLNFDFGLRKVNVVHEERSSSGNIKAVFRYAYLDSDGRGVSLSDGIRSAPSGGTMDRLEEYYLGGNYYLRGKDLKLQLGLLSARSWRTPAGAAAEARTFGARSQMQLQF